MSKSVSDYLAEICGSPSAAAVYAYRGQEDSSWPLRSAAARRLRKHYGFDDENRIPSFSRIYVEYHQNVLIDPARTRGFDLEDGRTLADLEILAKLQHFGAATGLLDFTYSPLIALWFACRKKECDGKVFSINTTDPLSFRKIDREDMRRGISDVLATETDTDVSLPWIWEPIATGDAETRVLIQHSLFVIGRPSLAEEVARAIIIRKEDKVRLRNELDTIHAIREETLFKDVYGFASVNRSSYPIPAFEGPELYFLFGNRRAQEGDSRGAIDYFDRVVRLQPDHSAAYFHRGTAKSDLGLLEEAIADYDRVICLQPDAATAYVNRGTAKRKLGRLDEAIADYDRAIHFRPGLAEAYNNRGNAKRESGRYREALTDYNDALRLQPDLTYPYVNRGAVKDRLGKHEAAIADFDRAIHLQPDLAEAYVNRGSVKHNLGRHDEAIADFDQAIRIQPGLTEAYNNRGSTKAAAGQYEGAVNDFDQAIRLRPDLATAYAGRGVVKGALGRYEDALNDFDQVIHLQPGSVSAYTNRGHAKLDLGRHVDAIADYDQAIRLQPDDVESFIGRGEAQTALGRIAEARSDLEAALALAQTASDDSLMVRIRRLMRKLDGAEQE